MPFLDVDTADPTVADSLNLIEADLAEALAVASARCQSVLDGKPAETAVLHSHIAEMNLALSNIAGNAGRRARNIQRAERKLR